LAKHRLCAAGGALDRREAASSVASISTDMDAPCVLASRRPAAPLRRGPFRQALLVDGSIEGAMLRCMRRRRQMQAS
jgi:hypothetical protein